MSSDPFSNPPTLEDHRQKAEGLLKKLQRPPIEDSGSESPTMAKSMSAFPAPPAPRSRGLTPPPAPREREETGFAGLALLAQALNSESDDLNSTIQAINSKLRALNLGVEAWCKGSDGDYGFARVAEEWQLATRWDGEDIHGRKEKCYAPLLKRTRDERIEGLELAPEIVRKLKNDAECKIAAIRKAKEFAASL